MAIHVIHALLESTRAGEAVIEWESILAHRGEPPLSCSYVLFMIIFMKQPLLSDLKAFANARPEKVFYCFPNVDCHFLNCKDSPISDLVCRG